MAVRSYPEQEKSMGCVVLKRKDQAVPTELVAKILANNPSCLGYAATKEGEVILEIMNEPFTAERFDDTQADLIPYEMVWHFGNMPDKYFEDEIQPFELLKLNGKCILAAAIEGDLAKLQHGETPRTGEFFLAHEYLIPKLTEMLDDAGNDLAKLLEKMRRPSFMKDLNNNIGPGSTVVFIAGDGQILTFGHNNSLTEAEWGWTSRNYGMSFNAAEAPAKKPGLGSRLTGAVKQAAQVAVTAAKTQVTTTARTESTVIAHVNDGVMMAPPPECDTKAKKKDWYLRMTGVCPEGYKNGPKVLVAKDKIEIKDFTTAAEVIAQSENKAPVSQTKTAVVNKDVKDNALPVDGANTTQPEIASKPPLFPTEQKKAINGLMERGKLLKIVDINSTEVIDPNTIVLFEKKHPNFFQQAGLDRTHVDRWPFDQLLILAKTCPEALAVLAMTYRNESIKLGGPKKFTTAQQEFAKAQPVQHQQKATGTDAKPMATAPSVKPTATAKREGAVREKYAL